MSLKNFKLVYKMYLKKEYTQKKKYQHSGKQKKNEKNDYFLSFLN